LSERGDRVSAFLGGDFWERPLSADDEKPPERSTSVGVCVCQRFALDGPWRDGRAADRRAVDGGADGRGADRRTDRRNDRYVADGRAKPRHVADEGTTHEHVLGRFCNVVVATALDRSSADVGGTDGRATDAAAIDRYIDDNSGSAGGGPIVDRNVLRSTPGTLAIAASKIVI